MAVLVSKSDNKKIEVYSFFPIDRADCDCRDLVKLWKKKLGPLSKEDKQKAITTTKFLVCPKNKAGMRRYKIVCKNCNEIQGYCWASDNTLRDWCDFHYTQWTDGEQWFGCLSPHVSPITEELCLECVCGQDTRDFRANMTLPPKVAYEIESKNKIGRLFGKSSSAFSARVVKVGVIPFK